MKNLVDSHCHLTDERVWSSVDQQVSAAIAAGVDKIRIGGLEPKEWDRQIILQKKYPNLIRTTFGLHPWWIEKYSQDEIADILNLLESRISECEAIGETGLDFFPKRDPARFSDQEIAFRKHIQLARKFSKPVVLHVVKAHEAAIKIIREEKCEEMIFQVHSFSGSAEEAKLWLKLPQVYLSFCGNLVRETHSKLQKVLRQTPHSRILLETDAPDQGWRKDGKNAPAFIGEIYEKTAQVLDLSAQTIAEIVAENFARFK